MAEFISRRIDELIISCAIGNGCDEAELMRLASEYGAVSDSYKFSNTLLAFDFEHEKQIALRLQKEVNDNIRRFRSAFGSNGRVRQLPLFHSQLDPRGITFKTWKHYKPKPKASPKKACSPKTRRSCNILGGKRRIRIKSKRRH
jgi:hypothetical protein